MMVPGILRGMAVEVGAMIEASGLTKCYGPLRAVDGISFSIEAGRVVGILGPNGAGKTTTIRMLTGYMPATSGSARVNGFDVFRESLRARASIGYLPEGNPLYGEMRVREQLHYFGRLHGMDRASRVRRLGELTDRCGLGKIMNRPIGQLSKGNRQRVGLAQALLHDPPVVVLDEPTIGLDPSQIGEVRMLIRDLAQEKTVLLSTHILPEVERSCQHVIILAGGKVVAEGSPEELRAKVRKGSRVIVEVKGEPGLVRAAFEKIARVGTVEASGMRDGWCRAAVTPRVAGEDIRELLADVAVEKRWVIREIRHEAASLEEYFVQVTNPANVKAP